MSKQAESSAKKGSEKKSNAKKSNEKESSEKKVVDSIQERLTSYTRGLNYDDLTPEAIHSAKVRVIDTLGALIGGFFAELSQVSRNLAAQLPPDPKGATIIGTRRKTTPDMAAFVNCTTQRYIELTDSYHWPGAYGGHPSDVVTPLLAAAEHAQSSGRDYITSLVLGYEIYLRINDVFHNRGFDHTIHSTLATAAATGKLFGLSPEQLSHCIAMAIVPNNGLRQARMSQLTMWKSTASGYAGRAGVFAAMMARAGMEGPHLPFEGKSGWCDHVARERFSLDTMGGNGTPFKIMIPAIKLRPASGMLIPTILAAEKIAPLNIKNIKSVTAEANNRAITDMEWYPETADTAIRSIPYGVAVTLMDGTFTTRSNNEAHLSNPDLRALMHMVDVVENEEFTKAYRRVPVEHCARVTVITNDGERLVGEAGGSDNLAGPKTDEQIVEKFRGLTEDVLGTKRVNAILDRLWHLEDSKDVSAIPLDFVFV